MARDIDQSLAAFKEADLTVRVCRTLFGAVPGAPPFVLYSDLAGAARRLDAAISPEALGRARQIAQTPEIDRALWVSEALDAGDVGLAVFSGMKNVFALLGGSRGERRRTFESDPQQALDAAVKLLGLAYITHNVFGGPVAQKPAQLLALPAGREIALYFGAAEVALPFADNLVEGAAQTVSRLLRAASGEGASRFSQVAGAESLRQAIGMIDSFRGPLEGVLDQARGSIGALPGRLQGFVPAALNLVDSAAGAAASGLDAIPVWRFLGPRLVAEACAQRALRA